MDQIGLKRAVKQHIVPRALKFRLGYGEGREVLGEEESASFNPNYRYIHRYVDAFKIYEKKWEIPWFISSIVDMMDPRRGLNGDAT